MDDSAWIGPLAMLLLIVAALFQRTIMLRTGLVMAALAAIILEAVMGAALPTTLWHSLAWVMVSAHVARQWLTGNAARFDPREEALRSRLMPGLPKGIARHLVDQGNWIKGRSGETLTRENEAVSHLFYLYNGSAQVSLAGQPVGQCAADDLIGDATALSGAPATASVTLSEDSEFWCIAAPALRDYLAIHSEARGAIERRINAALEAKLKAANQALAGG